MRIRSLALASAVAAASVTLTVQPGFAGFSLLSKGLAKLAKAVGGLTTASISNLDDVALTINVGSNLHTDKLGSLDQSWFSGWKTGGDAVNIMVTKKNAGGFYKVDGGVTIDGKPANYTGVGSYATISDASASPRKVEIATTSGQKSSFTVEPSHKQVKLVSINGKKDGDIALDLTKDAELELSYPKEMEGAPIKVSVAINQIGVKSIYEVCWLRAAPKVTVPASAFRNINIAPASTALYSFKGSYLSVGAESKEKAKDVSGPIKDIEYTASYEDGKLVTVSVEPKLNTGLALKGKDDKLAMKYDFFKPNAYRSRPFAHLKSIGLKSFSIRGTTFSQTSHTSTSETATTITTTTTTTTLQFPMQPDSVWDALLEKLYPEFASALETELGAKVLPVEAVTHAASYQKVSALSRDDQNTKVNFSRGFRDTKVVSAFMPVTDGYGTEGLNARLMDESGADGLLSMTLDLEISSKDKLVVMIPKFGFEIMGRPNGPMFDTKYCSGTIASAEGVSFNKNVDQAELLKIIRKTDMLAVFRKGLHDLVEQEKANGDYGPVWALQLAGNP